MDNVLYFNTKKTCENHEYDFLCTYLGSKSLQSPIGFYAALEKALKKSDTLPDCIMAYLPSEKLDDCSQYWKNKELHDSFLNRLSRNGIYYTKALFFVEVKNESFVIHNKFCVNSNPIELNNSDAAQFYSHGLNSLVKNNNVLHVAPAGHTFKHPSGRANKLFIQSRELANTETELQFVGKGLQALIKGIPWPEIKTIFIDTMGIYPIVKAAALSANCMANIESYHSYVSLKKLNLPTEEYLIVISASTSGGMAENLVSRGFSRSKIITLIDIEDREPLSHVLINLSSTDLLDNLSHADGNETDIELVGEHFSYRAKPPKQITLGVPHKPKYLLDILKDFGISGINLINQQLESIGKSPLLSLKPETLHNSEKFQKWLDEELSWSLSSSINKVIYSDDGASRKIADKAIQFMKESNGEGKSPSLLKWPELGKEDLKDATGVLVITAFAGDGGKLRQISRDLREYESETIPRHFLIGVGLPQSMESWKKLEQFLIRNATSRSYNFSVWKVLPLGPDNIKKSWDELSQLAASAQNRVSSPLESINDDKAFIYYDALADFVKESHNSLLPTTNNEQLKLTEGFVFFNGLFDDKIVEVTQSDTLLAIASVLQTAREHANPEKRLKPTNYQSVIISPENFLRFNDDILQACILRASLPSELDYSSDHHLSELMKEFLYKVFSRHEHSYGYAALEFAGALAIGKLKLKKEHNNQLIKNSLEKIGSTSNALSGFLLMAYK